jgi:hypothetical protein
VQLSGSERPFADVTYAPEPVPAVVHSDHTDFKMGKDLLSPLHCLYCERISMQAIKERLPKRKSQTSAGTLLPTRF